MLSDSYEFRNPFKGNTYRMNYPAAPMSGIYASLRQATGYQQVIIITPQGAGNQTFTRLRRVYPPQAD